uniref:Receptor-like protein kinase FERONIA n=1 Tax=Tanacetum cinerariifolium TaxID=118510 RepID=A0A6L2MG87_TANCI|nr:receptor-like protein kinase FERONIA [Tanacetum cinerariifolium]
MDKANGAESTSSTSVQLSRRFTIAEIQSATNNFDDELVIGHGGLGKVYKGQISIEESSHFVAIKQLDSMSNQGTAEFKAEIEMLSKLRHCNLVSLIGYCDDNREMILVYVYMPRGTLYDHLHKLTATPLSWIQRLKIAIAMISDFGLSKISPINHTAYNVSVTVKGTFGYLDPEYFCTRKLTRKTDVYAFGVLLFELLSGMLAVDERLEEEDCSLAKWAQKCVKERKFDQTDLLELQEKYDSSADSPGTSGFTWMIRKYRASATNQNSGQGGTGFPKSNEKHTNQGSLVNRDGSDIETSMLSKSELNQGFDWKPFHDFRLDFDSMEGKEEDTTTVAPKKKRGHVPIPLPQVSIS